MGMFLNPDDILQVTAWTQQGSQCSLNVGTFFVQAINELPTDLILANLLANAWKPTYRAWLPSTASFEGVMLRRIFPNPTATVLSTIGSSTGLAEGDPLPAQVTGVITLKTNKPGQKYRGRKFVGFGSEDMTDTAFVLNAGGVAVLNDIGDIWGIPHTYGVTDQVTLWPCLPDKTTPGLVELITSYQTRTYLATQKRRATLSKPNFSPF